MSLELNLYCKKEPSKEEIEQVILPIGFRPVEEYGGNCYFWFENKNLASIRGCWFSWKSNDLEDQIPSGTKTIFTSSTNYGRSYEDLEMQNKVIRELRKKFKGSVYNVWEDCFSYIENDIPKLTYPEKRCGYVYLNFILILQRVSEIPCEIPKEGLKEIMENYGILKYDPNLIRNNVLLPFLVSCLESFLKDFFIAYVDSQPNLWELIYERQGKVNYLELKNILELKVTLAEIEANNYSFQKLESANTAYEKFVGVNIFKIWDKRKKFKRKFYVVRDVIQELILLRHKIIHDGYIKLNLGKDEATCYITLIKHAGELFAAYLENEKNFRIDLEKFI